MGYKYRHRVIKTFRDKHTKIVYKIGSEYGTNDQARAEELQSLGFIGDAIGGTTDDEVDGLKHVGGGYWELPNGERVRGKDNAFEALNALDEAGDGVDQGK